MGLAQGSSLAVEQLIPLFHCSIVYGYALNPSFRRMPESNYWRQLWIPAYAGMTDESPE